MIKLHGCIALPAKSMPYLRKLVNTKQYVSIYEKISPGKEMLSFWMFFKWIFCETDIYCYYYLTENDITLIKSLVDLQLNSPDLTAVDTLELWAISSALQS